MALLQATRYALQLRQSLRYSDSASIGGNKTVGPVFGRLPRETIMRRTALVIIFALAAAAAAPAYAAGG
ncbi:MAG: hypothetical protein OTI36_11675, partial [Beijerinckiaceae bacterium]|nr:hypothetical protein [Beijerinckiaceae bacterium]